MDGPGQTPSDADPRYRALIERLYSRSRGGMVLGLERVERVLELLDHPERAFRAVHVAGSNGKGSTSAFLASVLSTHGLHVGLFTSPHLVSLTERIQFLRGSQGAQIEKTRLVAIVESIEALGAPAEQLTFFELITVAAFVAFRDAGIDLAVVEAGLGARLDATRLVDAEVAVLTDLSLEHTDFLGETLAEVAREEAAVVRPGRPIVYADGPAEALEEVERMISAAGATPYRLGRHMQAGTDDGGLYFELAGRRVAGIRLGLLGRHQVRNAILAAQTAVLLRPNLTNDALRAGLEAVSWPGRMEIVRRPGQARILLDGAHNAHGAEVLAAALAASKAQFSGPLHFVFGVLEDKDAARMLDSLSPMMASLALTRPPTARARDPKSAEKLLRHGPKRRTVEPNPQTALAWAQSQVEADGGWIVVCGSLYLVGFVKSWLQAQQDAVAVGDLMG